MKKLQKNIYLNPLEKYNKLINVNFLQQILKNVKISIESA